MSYCFFSGLTRPLHLDGCGHLLPRLSEHFAAWPLTVADTSGEKPCLRIRPDKGGYLTEDENGRPLYDYETETRLLGDLGLDMAEMLAGQESELLVLHCAAVAMAGRLVVFPNTNRAGKSLLAACLLARGHRLFADDLLGLTADGLGRSFGLPSRLRLPLPPLPPDCRAFVQRHAGLSDSRYLNLKGDAKGTAKAGDTAPIAAFVLLDRRKRTAPALLRAPDTVCLQHVLYQHQMREGAAKSVYERSLLLVGRTPGFVLRYAKMEDALMLLEKAFASGLVAPGPNAPDPAILEKPGLLLPKRARRMGRQPSGARAPGTKQYRRRPGVRLDRRGNEAFLIHDASDAIFYLNAVAGAVWDLLSEPLSEAEAAALLGQAFPDAPRHRLERDMMRLFDALKNAGLIEDARTI